MITNGRPMITSDFNKPLLYNITLLELISGIA